MNEYRDLITGSATYTGDLAAPGMLHLGFVRSPVASARIVGIDLHEALAMEGVIAVYVAGDLPMVPVWEIAMIPERFAQPALADGEVRYVGERVAAVVATSPAVVEDAIERVVVDYEPRAPIIDARDTAPDDVCVAWPSDAPGASFDDAAIHVALECAFTRLSPAPMEGHAVLADPDDDGRLTLWLSTQVPTAARRQVCRTLGLTPDRVRVITPFVGGGFGGKAAGAVVDHMVVAAAALELRRPVRYVEDRSANLLSMQGRGMRIGAQLHATRDGDLVGIRADIVADAGAYPNVAAVEPGKTRLMLCGPYRMRIADIEARAVKTNLPPVGAYRGPGRSEASQVLERSLDVLAADLGIDPLEIRRRNALRPDELPYAAATGVVYDSGDYPAVLDRLAAASGYEQLRADQATRRDEGGPLLGIGVSLVLDSTAWFSRTEGAAVQVADDGTVVVLTGSSAGGQHHETAYRSIVRSLLPVPDEQIVVVEGDTDHWSESDGTMGSRTAQLAGTAVLRATEQVVDRLCDLAADRLEAARADIVFHDGAGFGVRGVPTTALGLAALAAAAPERIEASCVNEQAGATYPAAAHLSLVEVDVETGQVRPLRHVTVTDCGRVLDPVSARAQVVGATVQGIGQALYEASVFDSDGNPLTTTFADYAIPAATEVPMIEAHFLETITPQNPLGAKGVGEIGMIGAPVAVQNAVVDAIRHLGVRHVDMPCTPERVWTALNA